MYLLIPFASLISILQKRRLLLLLWLLIAAGNAGAQKGVLDFGIHAGIAMTRLYDVQKTTNDFYFRTVPETGLQLSYGIGHRLSLGTELNYTSISTERKISMPCSTAIQQSGYATITYTSGTERIDINYIEMPLLISGHIGCQLKLFCGVGPLLGLRLNARHTTSADFSISNNTGIPDRPLPPIYYNENITDDTHTINLGGCQRMGLSYPLANGRIWLEARYSFGQMDIWKKGLGIGANQTDQLVLRVAYTVSL